MDEPLIDPTTFTELRDAVGEDFIGELVDTFLAEAPLLLATLREAAAAGDKDSYRRAAHSLKNGSANVGARQLSELCAELEQRGRHGPLDELEQPMAEFEQLYQRTGAALRALQAQEP